MRATIPAPAARLLDFIADGESGGGYKVIYGHHEDDSGVPDITGLSLRQLLNYQGHWGALWGSSAAGRYQIMPDTLRSLIFSLQLSGEEIFDADMQDRLGYALLVRRGYGLYMPGALSVVAFGKALAQEWASLPVLADTQGAHGPIVRGQSYYAGDGLNKADVNPERFEAVLRAIRLDQLNSAPIPAPIQPAPIPAPVKPKGSFSLNLSLLTLIISHLNLLPYLQQDVTQETTILGSSADGTEKLAKTLVVLKNLIAQVEASMAGQQIPPAQQ